VVEKMMVSGSFIAVQERAFWTTDKGKEVSQQSLAVYELQDGLIRRVYYFPAEP
jgi:hypothetical protein